MLFYVQCMPYDVSLVLAIFALHGKRQHLQPCVLILWNVRFTLFVCTLVRFLCEEVLGYRCGC